MRYVLTVALVAVASVSLAASARAGVVVLTTGESLTGEVTAQSDESVTLEHPVLGALSIPRDKVESVVVEAAEEQAEESAAAEKTVGEAEAEPSGGEGQAAEGPVVPANTHSPPLVTSKGLLPGWDKRVEVGFTGSEGNTENSSLRAAFLANFENDVARWIFATKYYYATTDGETTDNNFAGGLRKDWLFADESYFLFSQVRYEYDQFEAWRHRGIGNAGIGFAVIDEEDLALNTLFGAGVTKEFSGEREFRPEALLGLELLRWNTFEGHQLTGSTTLLPDLGDAGEFRWVNEVAYTIAIDRAKGLSLKFGIDHEYQSEVAPNNDNHDVKYFGSLVYDF